MRGKCITCSLWRPVDRPGRVTRKLRAPWLPSGTDGVEEETEDEQNKPQHREEKSEGRKVVHRFALDETVRITLEERHHH